MWTSPTGRRGAGPQRAAGVVHPARDRRDPVRGRAARRRHAARRAVRPARQRARPDAQSNDPRVAAALDAPLAAEHRGGRRLPRRARAPHPAQSGLRIAAGDGPRDRVHDGTALRDPRRGRPRPADGRRRRRRRRAARASTKYLAYGWSARRSAPALRAQVDAALAGAHADRLGRPARRAARLPRRLLGHADVEIDGDAELQQAVRFALFHVLQAGARGESRAIPAKGLTGPGYDGHAFWDTETFVLPVLTYTVPDAARDALRWRHSTLDQARERAAALGLRGAAFPWRHHQRRGVLRLLAGRHRRVPRQRRHRRCGRPLRRRHRRRGLRARVRRRAAGGDRAAVVVARPPRPARRLPHRRRHRAGRVHARSQTTTSTRT